MRPDLDHRRQNLWRIALRRQCGKPALAFSTADPDKARRATVGRRWPAFHQIVQLAQLLFGHRSIGPRVARAGRAEQSIKDRVV
jgi:hypothetical protein